MKKVLIFPALAALMSPAAVMTAQMTPEMHKQMDEWRLTVEAREGQKKKQG
ncbi:MAG: hypothetical protein JRI59_03315 [Deltaproteobacteria bacterium]|nr:hypothetical protein [Deltaproteobacteria bacterium]